MEFVSSAEELLNQFQRLYVQDAISYEILGHCDALPHAGRVAVTSAQDMQQIIHRQLHLATAKGYVWECGGMRFEQEAEFVVVEGTSGAEMSSQMWCLKGRTLVGENTEDEWLTLWVLMEATKGTDVLLRTWDSDGEVLLIEAAAHIPKWVRPENSLHRVWVRDGLVHIISPTRQELQMHKKGKGIPGLSRLDAIRVMNSSGHTLHLASEAVQLAVQNRVKGFPQRAHEATHVAVCVLPVVSASLLASNNQMVSGAVRAFCNRSPDSQSSSLTRTLSKLKHTAPHTTNDFVCVRVKMSRWHYAQLQYHEFGLLKQFHVAAKMYHDVDGGENAISLGSKLAYGLEMLCTTREDSRNDYGYPDPPKLQEQCKRLQSLEPSALLEMVADMQVAKQNIRQASDDDSWMYCTPEEFDTRLKQASQGMVEEAKPQSVDDLTAFTNIVKGMDQFMNTSASFEGAEVPHVPKEMVQGMDVDMGVVREILSRKGYGIHGTLVAKDDEQHKHLHTLEEVHIEDYFESEDEEKSSEDDGSDDSDDLDTIPPSELTDGVKFSCRAASMFSSGGFIPDCKLESEAQSVAANDSDDCCEGEGDDTCVEGDVGNSFMEEYMHRMDEELAGTSLDESFMREDGARNGTVDVEANLLQNLLESFLAQGDAAGPATNMLGEMGLRLPRPNVDV